MKHAAILIILSLVFSQAYADPSTTDVLVDVATEYAATELAKDVKSADGQVLLNTARLFQNKNKKVKLLDIKLERSIKIKPGADYTGDKLKLIKAIRDHLEHVSSLKESAARNKHMLVCFRLLQRFEGPEDETLLAIAALEENTKLHPLTGARPKPIVKPRPKPILKVDVPKWTRENVIGTTWVKQGNTKEYLTFNKNGTITGFTRGVDRHYWKWDYYDGAFHYGLHSRSGSITGTMSKDGKSFNSPEDHGVFVLKK